MNSPSEVFVRAFAAALDRSVRAGDHHQPHFLGLFAYVLNSELQRRLRAYDRQQATTEDTAERPRVWWDGDDFLSLRPNPAPADYPEMFYVRVTDGLPEGSVELVERNRIR